MSGANVGSERRLFFADTFSLGRRIVQSCDIFETYVNPILTIEGYGSYKGNVTKSRSPGPIAYAIVYLSCTTSIGFGRPVEPEECEIVAGRLLSSATSMSLSKGGAGPLGVS